MPTERFCRLPEEKKQVIREAALKEFARVPYEKASINQIIRNADISRGSFYTYFVDKQDVVTFLMKDQLDQMKLVCQDALLATGGDYFAMLERLFEYFVGESQKAAEMLDVARNIFSHQENAQILGMGTWPPPDEMAEGCSPAGWIHKRLNKECFRFQQPEEYIPMMTMATSSLLFAIKQFYDYPDQVDTIRRHLHQSLEILKYGSYRNKD